MFSPSVPDSVTNATPKGQSLTEQRPITDDKSASDLNPSDQGGGSGKRRRRKRKRAAQKIMEECKAKELFSSGRKEEGKGDIVPPSSMTARLQERTLESRFPIPDDHHLRCTDQTWPSQYGGRVHDGLHIPSQSSEPVISNAPSLPVTSGATSVVQPPSSVSGQTPLPKPALVSPAPLLPPPTTLHENCKVDYHRPRMLEQNKNDEEHQKNRWVCEELVQRHNTVNGKQSGQIHISQLNLTGHRKNVQKSEKNGCSSQNIASGFMVDNCTRDIQLQINVGKISEVPAEAPEGKTVEKGGKYMGTKKGSKQRVKVFTCDACHVKHMSRAAYDKHMNGSAHLSIVKLASDRVAALKQAVSDAINYQVQRGNGNSALFAELLTTVLSKTKVTAIEPVTCALAADIPTHISVAGPSYQPRLSEIQAHAKIPAPTSMAGPSSKPQLLQTQASEIQAHVEIEDPSSKTKTELAVDAEILAAQVLADTSIKNQSSC